MDDSMFKTEHAVRLSSRENTLLLMGDLRREDMVEVTEELSQAERLRELAAKEISAKDLELLQLHEVTATNQQAMLEAQVQSLAHRNEKLRAKVDARHSASSPVHAHVVDPGA